MGELTWVRLTRDTVVDGAVRWRGETVLVDGETLVHLVRIQAGIVLETESEKQSSEIETMAVEPPERAVIRKRRRRG